MVNVREVEAIKVVLLQICRMSLKGEEGGLYRQIIHGH